MWCWNNHPVCLSVGNIRSLAVKKMVLLGWQPEEDPDNDWQ
jgi:hypothetical protein